MKCPDCENEISIESATLKEISGWWNYWYPQDIFKSHPVAWIRRLLKWLTGASDRVLVDENRYTEVED